MTQTILARFVFRHGTAAEWTASNEVLLADEGGHESDTNKLKIGDGVTSWNDLDYFAGGVGGVPFAVGAGSGDAITATYTPAVTLADGVLFSVRAHSANTVTTPTFDPNGLGALTITKLGGQPLVAGDIARAGHDLLLQYDATPTPARYELLNPATTSAAVGKAAGVQEVVVVAPGAVPAIGAGLTGFFAPFDCTITDFLLGALTAPTSGSVTADLKKSDAATMLSALPSIASGTHNSLSSPATINPARNVVLKGDYVTVDLTAVGGGASGIIGAISYAPYTAPVTGDPYWANVTLMCNMEGADGSTVFTDDSGFNTLVAHGTVNIQNNLADFSGAGSDTSTSITAASIPSHDLPADFTIETSITFTDVSPNQYLFAVGNNGLILQLYLGIPRVYCAATGTSSPLYSNGPTLVDGVRYKLEVVRKSGVITAYCNGVSWGADATTQDFSADVYTIGNNGGGGLPARGMIGPTRVTKGVGRYTGGHTPDFGPFPTST